MTTNYKPLFKVVHEIEPSKTRMIFADTHYWTIKDDDGKTIGGKYYSEKEATLICAALNHYYEHSPEEVEEFKKITGFDTPKEFEAYEKGRLHEQTVLCDFVSNWAGNTNSELGARLHAKFLERSTQLTAQNSAMAEALEKIIEIHKSIHPALRQQKHSEQYQIATTAQNKITNDKTE